MRFLLFLFLLPGLVFVTIPSLIYGISPLLLFPFGFLVTLLTFSTSRVRAGAIADKIAPFFLILGLPAILYFWVSKPVGIGFSSWMIVYFAHRYITGAAARDSETMKRSFEAAKALEDFHKLKTSEEMNLFERHLDWTSLLGYLLSFTLMNVIATYWGLIIGGIAMLFISAWVILRKGRRLWWLLLSPIYSPLWLRNKTSDIPDSTPKIDGKELQECLAFFEAETKVIAFQTKEADLYNNAMVKYGNSITENPMAASEARKASYRLSLAATEILRLHEEIKNVPVAASAMHYAWYLTFYANAAWASAAAKAIEAMAEGMNPNTMYVKQLYEESQKAWSRADNEDQIFLKQLKVSAEELAKIVARATTIHAADDDWEPKMAE